MDHYKLLELSRAHYLPQLADSTPISFYFSATNDICLLEELVLYHFAEAAELTQQTFRDSIRVVALDPLELYVNPVEQCQLQWNLRGMAESIVSSIAKYTNLQRLVLLRGLRHEKEMTTLMRELTSDEASQGLDRIPLVLKDVARITVLPYEYKNWRKALSARKKVILAYAA